tara:strand:- start:125 stop:685 length:561 start_codon:yes stop_codon:yes gene_type:complete
MLSIRDKFKYRDWVFVEYINPRKSEEPDSSKGPFQYDGVYKSKHMPEERQTLDRIMNWFKHIEDEIVFDPNDIWDSLDTTERNGWFNNSKRKFISWWEGLPGRHKHYYVDRLMSEKPLLQDNELAHPNVQVTIIDKKLAIRSEQISVLDGIKKTIEDLHGWIEFEHRTKKNGKKEFHTYIFDLKKE